MTRSFGLVLAVAAFGPAPLPAADRPNVLFVAIDDLNADLGCYGHPQALTPNIDKLAARGVRFDRAYCQYPLCNPSRASFLSGRRPEAVGIFDLTTAPRAKLPDAVFLPQHFRNHGYFTARVGKVFHDGRDDPASWDVSENVSWNAQEQAAVAARYAKGGTRTPDWRPIDGPDDATKDGTAVRRAVALMGDAARQGKPFFVAAGLSKPHLPWAVPKKYFDLYPPAAVRLAPDPAPRGAPSVALMTELTGNPQPSSRAEAVAAYRAAATFADAQVGVLLDALDRLKLADSTAVVLVSDHGFHLGEHGGLWAKLSLFEASARVPLVVAGHGAAAGRACPRTVELIDLYPTLADWCGLPAPAGVDGVSLMPLLKQPDAAWDRPAFTRVYHGKTLGRSVRTERYRYTEWDGTAAGVELYEYDKGWVESANLADDPAFAAVRRELRDRLGGDEK